MIIYLLIYFYFYLFNFLYPQIACSLVSHLSSLQALSHQMTGDAILMLKGVTLTPCGKTILQSVRYVTILTFQDQSFYCETSVNFYFNLILLSSPPTLPLYHHHYFHHLLVYSLPLWISLLTLDLHYHQYHQHQYLICEPSLTLFVLFSLKVY